MPATICNPFDCPVVFGDLTSTANELATPLKVVIPDTGEKVCAPVHEYVAVKLIAGAASARINAEDVPFVAVGPTVPAGLAPMGNVWSPVFVPLTEAFAGTVSVATVVPPAIVKPADTVVSVRPLYVLPDNVAVMLLLVMAVPFHTPVVIVPSVVKAFDPVHVAKFVMSAIAIASNVFVCATVRSCGAAALPVVFPFIVAAGMFASCEFVIEPAAGAPVVAVALFVFGLNAQVTEDESVKLKPRALLKKVAFSENDML